MSFWSTVMFVASTREYTAELNGGLHDGELVIVRLPKAASGPAAGKITVRGEMYDLWLYRVREDGNRYAYTHSSLNMDALPDQTPSDDTE